MKKTVLVVFMLLVVFITACQAPKKDTAVTKPAAVEKPVEDAAVNSVGAGINNVDSVENDLNADELSDLDSGLSDIENI